jgi:predicted alpha-1,2-mannosidase
MYLQKVLFLKQVHCKSRDFMSRTYLKKLYVLLAIFSISGTVLSQISLTDLVNPMIGTDGMGHTFPGACAPFGIVQLSPETDTIPQNVDGKYNPSVYAYCSGYQYRDSTIVGFSHTHLSGTGHADLGDIMLMPVIGPLRLNPGTSAHPESGYRSRYSHASERCSPGYYEVYLSDYQIRVRLTATQRVGIHEYTYPDNHGRFILDLGHGIYNYKGKTLWTYLRVVNDTLLTGYRITDGWARQNYTYFAISLSSPVKSWGYADRQKMLYSGFWRRFDLHHNFPDMAGREMVGYFNFDLPVNRKLVVKVALSGVSMAGAVKNLEAEAGGKSFEEIHRETALKWEKELKSIEVKGSRDQRAMFYTSYYHTMINPSVYMDVDGEYRGIDQEIHRAEEFNNYTIFSLWDTYRAEHPLLNLMKPLEGRDMACSMLKLQEQNPMHLLPVWSLMSNEGWCMSGYHSASVLADVLAKTGRLNVPEVLKSMTATARSHWMEGMDDYIRLGYVPYDHCSTSVSNTLEYAYDDWTVYRVALMEGDSLVASEFRKRALNYRNVYDSSIGMARPRYANGTFKRPFSPLQTYGEGFIEGNSANYSFHVPHDVFGMIRCMGGEKNFIYQLDHLFSSRLPKVYYEKNEDITEDGLLGGYDHGNEPSHHIAYLYAWTSQPWKTQYWVREIMNRMYRNNIDGLSGNDDCGQMSAWYIFSALGFYPVCPGTDQYIIGAPYMPYAKLNLPNGKTFEIHAPGVSDRRRYVREIRLNGKVYDKMYITHKDILNGGKLEFIMASKPNKKRGLSMEDKPYSLTLPER